MGWRFRRSRWLAISRCSRWFAIGCSGKSRARILVIARLDLYILPAKAAFDAEISVRYAVVQRRGPADDLAFLLMHRQVAAHAAIRADGVRLGLLALVPCAGLP